MELLAPVLKSFMLVFIAEFGDKSQIVCMTLAARYRPLPVMLGAIVAFSLLNLLGVTIGAVAARWLPEWLVLAAVCLLFLLFGIQSLRENSEDDVDGNAKRVGKHLLFSVVLLIFLAEFGDKTQIAVAGLAGVESALGVWIGSTLALSVTTLMGVLVGRAMLRRVPIHWVHRGGGVLFLLFALLAAVELLSVLAVIPGR
ncbi:TMEM165/GDT1 family protein [Pontibacterium sp. N1Y112]|uniref:GDT1 family protein n=1 Tax=Pontibacterium sinense TaxID=2781979 RepID=A0A8J7JXP0_9GAMM|nr:TMEM165/GDT1 family protein [Pontibacterium sinense]MBE9396543.1 TMEM165/GDT1 family protein [Pontibacterium sinense]